MMTTNKQVVAKQARCGALACQDDADLRVCKCEYSMCARLLVLDYSSGWDCNSTDTPHTRSIPG